jgi:hypothetical protein
MTYPTTKLDRVVDRLIDEENRRYLDDPNREAWLDEFELASRGLAFLTLCGLGPALAARAEAAAASIRGES